MKEPQGCNVEFLSHLFMFLFFYDLEWVCLDKWSCQTFFEDLPFSLPPHTKSMLFVYQSTPYLSFSKT